MHTYKLQLLAAELFDLAHLSQLNAIIEQAPANLQEVARFDASLGGPSIALINCKGFGRYAKPDRDVFRPLQYCSGYLGKGFTEGDIVWFARYIVQMSGLHLESLIKRVGRVWKLPLGGALRRERVKQKADPILWQQLVTFTSFYNDAKHNVSHAKDTHLFSAEDAILAYFVSRRLGLALYPLAGLVTDLTIFESECDEAEARQLAGPFGELVEAHIAPKGKQRI